MMKRFTTRKVAIYTSMLLGFLMLESPMILMANKIEPMMMGIPFFLVWNLAWWGFLTIVFLYAYLTHWGSAKASFTGGKR